MQQGSKNSKKNIAFFSTQMNIKLRKEGMEIEARHVRRKQLSQYLEKELLNRERKSMESATAVVQSLTSSMRKRVSTDPPQTPSKRSRANDSVRITLYDAWSSFTTMKFVQNAK